MHLKLIQNIYIVLYIIRVIKYIFIVGQHASQINPNYPLYILMIALYVCSYQTIWFYYLQFFTLRNSSIIIYEALKFYRQKWERPWISSLHFICCSYCHNCTKQSLEEKFIAIMWYVALTYMLKVMLDIWLWKNTWSTFRF